MFDISPTWEHGFQWNTVDGRNPENHLGCRISSINSTGKISFPKYLFGGVTISYRICTHGTCFISRRTTVILAVISAHPTTGMKQKHHHNNSWLPIIKHGHPSYTPQKINHGTWNFGPNFGNPHHLSSFHQFLAVTKNRGFAPLAWGILERYVGMSHPVMTKAL